MTRYEAALEVAAMTGAIRQSDEPGALAASALSELLESGLFMEEEVDKVQLLSDVVRRMNSREFADEIADEVLSLLAELEPGSGLRQ